MKKYLLAVDPYENELRLTDRTGKWTEHWLKAQNASLEVIYVFSTSRSVHPDLDRTIAEAKLRDYVSRLNFGVPVTSNLIIEESSSNRSLVQALNSHAEDVGVEMILLTSYGRRLIGRLVLGSFADRLLAESSVPLFFLNSTDGKVSDTRHVLFTTDFSEASKKAFEIFLEQFEGIHPKVTLFHANPPFTLVYSHGLPFGIPDHYAKDLNQFVQEESTLWLNFARAKNYEIDFRVSTDRESVVHSINRAFQELDVDMIALASSRGKSRTRVLGSVASSLFYQRACPVWICGPEAFGLRQAKAA